MKQYNLILEYRISSSHKLQTFNESRTLQILYNYTITQNINYEL